MPVKLCLGGQVLSSKQSLRGTVQNAGVLTGTLTGTLPGTLLYGALPYGALPYGTLPYGTLPYGTPPYGNLPYGTLPSKVRSPPKAHSSPGHVISFCGALHPTVLCP